MLAASLERFNELDTDDGTMSQKSVGHSFDLACATPCAIVLLLFRCRGPSNLSTLACVDTILMRLDIRHGMMSFVDCSIG